MSEKRKRITVRLKTPNPLFEKWIAEWRDKAREHNSKMEYSFNRALEALKKYPLPLESGRDCKILRGFGDKICQMLDQKLKEHRKNSDNNLNTVIGNCTVNNGEPEPANLKKSNAIQQVAKKESPTKEYCPKENSGGYAILLTLYKKGLEPSYRGYLSKLELIREAQFLSETSFTRPDPGSRYTAWSSMQTLVAKRLVEKKSNPAKFSLTDYGLLLAKKLYDRLKNNDLQSTSGIHNAANDGMDIELSTESNTNVTEAPQNDLFKNSENECSTASHSIDNISVEHIYSDYSTHLSKQSDTYLQMEDVIPNDRLTTSSVSNFTDFIGANNKNNMVVSQPQSSKTIQKYASASSIASSTQSSSQEETVIVAPNSFDIILCVDTCETGGSNMDIQDDPILAELQHLAVLFEVKKLKVGDYMWICRDRATKTELVLPYIIERKRMDDFGDSIKDGRYHEQKFRLKKSGIQHITYLIEKYGKNQHVGLPIASLYQAASNTAVQDGFCVTFTENYKDTAKYLANFSGLMVKMFKSKTLVSCPKENLSDLCLDDDLQSLMTFKEFNKTSSKNKPLTVSDLFIKVLIQIKGMSVDRALAIVNEYPTPATLRKAYEESPGTKGEKLLAQVQFGDGKKCIGQVLSKTVYQLFTKERF